MKLLSLLVSLAVAVSGAAAEPAAKPEIAKGDFKPTEEKPFDLRVEYLIKDKQTSPTELIGVENGETITIDYQFYNGEEDDCTILGVGGKLISPVTGDTLYNITATNIGPLSVGSQEVVSFSQKIGIDLNPDSYLVVPSIYVVFKEQIMMLGSRNQLIQVDDPNISIFNPKLLVLEVILAASVGGIVYFLYTLFGARYFGTVKKDARKQKLPATKPSKTAPAKVDESWLPETHLKTKRRTTRKN
ncbi:hypothetical protein KL905_003553 [Ogataea polymorpha]|uniref:Uncharacterized protein n=1 Tax=Ogataea polymorpha TaxID=460523 RepID=A0A1B7SAX5_9ASCO|nr:uncharacterized protein OGAPODRAFT_95779 [Ogataea polymorpha]KAG7879052.1 hypothetical protein KL937_003465 [Ogataea polymorpha]KAG7887917.1 hypothetical protein KL936_003935 [Ogataea polymorpha]KAG7899371.1 hypothetical protein KL935_003681 [Ogataea polymorpha]KAG7904587.1 hypothetical protein KL907_003463 [Ogataea polymorpha]KAG7907636.1 hypothetical protein KL906_003717 [Ogataea polymorpha]